MDKHIALLERLFLTKLEIKVYLTLLEHGGMGSVALARTVDMHRPRLAEILATLRQRGFVSVVQSGKRSHYEAVAPYILVEQAKDLLNDTKQLLPELLRVSYQQKQKDAVSVYHGEEGLALCFLDVVQSLDKGALFYQINSSKDQPYVDGVVPTAYRPIRDSKKLTRRAITTRYVGQYKTPRLERSIRYIEDSDEMFDHNVIQFIYGNKVSLLDFNSLTGTIIENKAIADFQKSIFSTLYKRLPQ